MFQVITLLTAAQIYLATTQDLRSIFHTPSKRNYDDFEILERTSFGKDGPETPTESPRAYANAQVSLKFGAEAEDAECRCRWPFVPLLAPQCSCCVGYFQTPPCYLYAPPTPLKPHPCPLRAEAAERGNRPEVWNTFEIPMRTLTECPKISTKLQSKEASPNVKFVYLDMSKVLRPEEGDFDNCLIPDFGLKQNSVFDKDKIVPLIEKRQAQSDESVEYVPIVESVLPEGYVNSPANPSEDCDCCGCSTYTGELNERAA